MTRIADAASGTDAGSGRRAGTRWHHRPLHSMTGDGEGQMTFVPEFMPMLSPGKHRSPRSGGCFMEIASFLAGDRWSDHPKCTDPALAELCRCVNDVMPDSTRSRLSLMIPSVIGTGGRNDADRMRIAARIVRECTLVGLPLVSVKTGPLACALLVPEHVLDENTRGPAPVLPTQPDPA